MENFLSDEAFTKQVQKQAAKKWRDLTTGVLYRIDKVKTVNTMYGAGTILEMTTREGDGVQVWAPERLVEELGWFEPPRYVRPLGLTACKRDPTKSFHNNELV